MLRGERNGAWRQEGQPPFAAYSAVYVVSQCRPGSGGRDNRSVAQAFDRNQITMSRRPAQKNENDVLWKGLLCAAIGLAVLISPSFMPANSMRDTIAGSSLVGWFALALGIAFIAQFAWQRRQRAQRSDDRS